MIVTFHLINKSLWNTSVKVPNTSTIRKVISVIFSILRYLNQVNTSARAVATINAPEAT
ncbi:hypothetical protein D3C78_981440 [compost metagenome]